MAVTDRRNRAMQPFIPNSKLIFTLPLGMKIMKGNIIITGQIGVSGVSVAGTQLAEGGPVGLVKQIYVTATPANGSRYPGGMIVNCTPRSLLRYAIAQHNGKYISEINASTLGAGANGTYNIYLSIPIYWADTTLRNAVGTSLNADPANYASIQVEVDTGDLTSCFVGNNGTVNWSGLTVQWADERADLPGDTLVLYQEDHAMLIAATFPRAVDYAMPQDGSFCSWTILQEQGIYATLSNALLQRVTIQGANLTYDKYTYDIQQQDLDDEWLDPATPITGWAHIDFTDSALQNIVPAQGLTAQFQVTNVSGANLDDLRFYTRRVLAALPSN